MTRVRPYESAEEVEPIPFNPTIGAILVLVLVIVVATFALILPAYERGLLNDTPGPLDVPSTEVAP